MTDDLSQAITDSLNVMADRAYHHIEEENYAYSAAILNEWTTESHQCVLTHHFQDTIETVTDRIIYSFFSDNDFGYGSFSFDPDAELVD